MSIREPADTCEQHHECWATQDDRATWPELFTHSAPFGYVNTLGRVGRIPRVGECVYGLLDDSGVIYIGRSTNLGSRLAGHLSSGRRFTHWHAYQADDINAAEREFLLRRLPLQNAAIPPLPRYKLERPERPHDPGVLASAYYRPGDHLVMISKAWVHDDRISPAAFRVLARLVTLPVGTTANDAAPDVEAELLRFGYLSETGPGTYALCDPFEVTH